MVQRIGYQSVSMYASPHVRHLTSKPLRRHRSVPGRALVWFFDWLRFSEWQLPWKSWYERILTFGGRYRLCTGDQGRLFLYILSILASVSGVFIFFSFIYDGSWNMIPDPYLSKGRQEEWSPCRPILLVMFGDIFTWATHRECSVGNWWTHTSLNS